MGFGGCLNWKSEDLSLIDTNSSYAVKPEHIGDVRKTRFKLRPGRTLSPRKWQSAFSEDGHLDIGLVLSRIQRGGVHPSIRGAVWEFLLGCYDPNSTYEDRNQLRQRKREQYGILMTECQKMEPTIGSGRYIIKPVITKDGQPIQDLSSQGGDTHEPGETTVSSTENSRHFEETLAGTTPLEKTEVNWKRTLHQIGLDVVRTDRALVFYESEANLAKLWTVLAIYAWIDKEIGYCQGMSDLCSPLVILLEDEADAFWCFERMMRRLRGNFKSTTDFIGVRSQLSVLAKIIKTVDPKLHQHLEDVDGGEYLFAVRMLMALFRREFSIMDSMYLWEMMWAMEYKPNIFTLYEQSDLNTNKDALPNVSDKKSKNYGKFARKNMEIGDTDQESSLAIFFVASVLELKNKQFMREAKGLDDVVKILNDIIGNLDVRKACKKALKVQTKYLRKKKEL
ncbi:Tbc1 domain family member [Thalictrum thalictroides]|uniref:Tbc1 domain family member n=1 Tax=Thalictrum thalictroides TaxID=46969 RepID=A0A7J6VHE2_THATH|nr:Tbc1 domain family member [Thalictrum thalictroides]